MIQQWVEKNGRLLRRGLTTGTCAASAAKAAAYTLHTGIKLKEVSVELPTGETVTLPVKETLADDVQASCSVVKDAGDDPDVTDGAVIVARARKTSEGFALKGGKGVGTVTKKGLEVPVGGPAINPVPAQMIKKEVSKVLPDGWGIEIEISVLDGGMIAGRTLNSKLGILGGISILGTTGVVEPMSLEAFKRSLSPQIDLALAAGFDEIILTPGRTSAKDAVSKGVPEDAVVITGNFIGYMLKECKAKGVKKIVIYGRAGKVAKLASGAYDTHSREGVSAVDILASYLSSPDDMRLHEEVLSSNTAEEAAHTILKAGRRDVLDAISGDASRHAASLLKGGAKVAVVIVSRTGEVLGAYVKGEFRWAGLLL